MKRSVTVVSVGPGDPGLMNGKTMDAVTGSGRLMLRTARHPLVRWLDQRGIPYESLDGLYETAEDFDQLSASVAEAVWKAASENGSVIYAVSDILTDSTVDSLFGNRPEDAEITVIPGFSYADYYLASCRGLFPLQNIRICAAGDFGAADYDPSLPVLITELNDEMTAGEIKNSLSAFLDDEETVYFLDSAADARPIPLYELDRQKGYDHLSAVAAPGRSCFQRKGKTLPDLLRIMDTLRSPSGCPWDRVQTHKSLEPYLIEEAWETADSIEAEDPVHLAEELGDLLFQIVFHTSIGRSFDEFTMDDVITGICDKMIRRHPHVFSRNHSETDSFSGERWDQIKQTETGSKTIGQSLNDISLFLPSLRYAEKIFRKLDQLPALKRTEKEIYSSIAENAKAMNGAEEADQEKMLGSMLLLCAELSHRLGTDSEVLLHKTVKRLIDSFQSAEKEFSGSDTLNSLTFKDLGVY